jgi:MFS family permease
MGLSRYRDLLRIPGVPGLLLAAFVARLPYGMFALSLILLLRAEGFDYAQIGIVTGASGLAVGVAAPVFGRVIDRVGQTRVLVGTAVCGAVADVAVVVAALSGAGTGLLALLALVGGLTVPPVSPSLRTLLPGVVGKDRLDTAFAFDALQLEGVFISGPLLAAGISVAASPQAAVLAVGALQTGGALAFAASPASRAWRPAEREPGTRRTGALSIPGLRTLVASLAITAISMGALEIGIPAFAERESSRADAGWLFALWGVGSLLGGLWYGARQWRRGAGRRYLFIAGGLTLGLAPLPLAGSLPVFAVVVVVAGLMLAPSTAACYSLVGELAPEGALTEAYAWQIVAYVCGSSVGAWVAGAVVDAIGVGAALACAPVGAGLGLLAALAGRRSLLVEAAPANVTSAG